MKIMSVIVGGIAAQPTVYLQTIITFVMILLVGGTYGASIKR